jgi:hypothetical protein
VIGLSLSSSTVTAGTSVTGTVTLSNAAPTGGTTVTLTGQTSTITFPSSFTIPAGSTTGTFTITTSSSITSPATYGKSDSRHALFLQPHRHRGIGHLRHGHHSQRRPGRRNRHHALRSHYRRLLQDRLNRDHPAGSY